MDQSRFREFGFVEKDPIILPDMKHLVLQNVFLLKFHCLDLKNKIHSNKVSENLEYVLIMNNLNNSSTWKIALAVHWKTWLLKITKDNRNTCHHNILLLDFILDLNG